MVNEKHRRTHPVVVTLDDLSRADVDRMYEILCQHFDNVDRAVFQKDLSAKDWIIRINDVDGRIQGFTTLQHMVGHLRGERVHAFFSGDTVLAPDYMSESSWMSLWAQLAFGQAARLAPEKAYWLLMTATHRTYRILPTCFKHFVPDEHSAPDPALMELRDLFAGQRFPGEYKPETGTVVLDDPIPYRNGEQVEAAGGEHHAANRYFREINPHYLRGDFLACLTELDPNNLTTLGRRFLKGGSSARSLVSEVAETV